MLKSVKWGKDSQRFRGKRTHDEVSRPTLEMASPTRYFKISMGRWDRPPEQSKQIQQNPQNLLYPRIGSIHLGPTYLIGRYLLRTFFKSVLV